MSLKRFFLLCLYYLQVHRLMRYLLRKKLIILMYHGFTDQETHEGIENHQGKHLFIERFKLHLEYLKKYHHVIPLEQWLESKTSGKQIPEGSVVITFDDGYQSNYTLAFPLLKAWGVPATIFLTTEFVDCRRSLWTDRVEYVMNRSNPDSFEIKMEGQTNGGVPLEIEFHDRASRLACEKEIRGKLKIIPQGFRSPVLEKLEQRLGSNLDQDPNPPKIYRPLKWSEVNEMLQSGLVSIGGHTHTHAILTKCRPEDVERELSVSRGIIEKSTAKPCRLFCYPNGAPGDFSQETKKWLQQSGYLLALTTVFGLNNPDQDPFELKRVGAPHEGDEVEFVMNLYSVTQFLSDLKQFLLNWFHPKREHVDQKE